MQARRPRIIHLSLVVLLIASTGVHALDFCPPLHVFDGQAARDNLGSSVSGFGDADGDGCDDVLVGAPGYDDPQTGGIGAVFLLSGATGEVLQQWFGEFTGLGGSGGFGVYLAGAGDVDGDGVPDVITSAHAYFLDGMTRAGRVYVYSGATGDLLWSWDGDRFQGYFGRSVDGAGDVNHDGYADLIVGQPGLNGDDFSMFDGKVYVYSGATGALLWSRNGDEALDLFGDAVAGIGDFDGDGTDDVAVGAPEHDPPQAYVLSGANGAVLWSQGHPFYDPAIRTAFGVSVAAAGDVNGDGLADVVVGAYIDSTLSPTSNNGSAHVFAGPSGDRLWSWEGEAVTDFFGFSVGGAGDVNGDGADDLVIGAYGHFGPAGWASGKAYVYSGATGRLLWFANGESSGDIFGREVAGVGDVDGDGLADVGVGAQWHRGEAGVDQGRAYVYRSVPRGDCDCNGVIDKDDLVAFFGCLTGAGVCWSVQGCGCVDLDGDGDVDLRDFAAFQAAYGFAP